MYFYCYVYVVFCFIVFFYRLYVNVYLQLPPSLNPVAVKKYINKTYHMSTGESTIDMHTTAIFVARILPVNFL